MKILKNLIGKGWTKTILGMPIYKLFVRLKPNSTNIFGYKIFLQRKRDIISESILLFKEYEPNQTKLIKQLVKKGDIVFDIGANIGYYTLLMSKIVGEKGLVFAFEPENINFGLLQKTINYNKIKNVILIKAAINNNNGIIDLRIAEDNTGGHTISPEYSNRKSTKVLSFKIDDFFSKYKPSLVKIDVEGAEQLVLDGSHNTFKDSIIIMEDSKGLENNYNLNIRSFDWYDNEITSNIKSASLEVKNGS